MKIAIQGEHGSFSHEAAERMLPRCSVVPCARSAEVFDRIENGSVSGAVIPIENTLAGTVAEHADLLVARDQRRRQVLSHPVALDQCRNFFSKHPQIEAVPFYDTAGSVKHVIQEKRKDAAGIAGKKAASQYGGRILAQGIEDDKRNFTRFFLTRKLRKIVGEKTLVSPKRGEVENQRLGSSRINVYSGIIPSGANKTSIAFKVKNVPGALFKSLSVFALRDISLSKIESRPMRGRPWEYVFYVDFLRGDDEAAQNALRHLEEVADFVKVLGIYPVA